MFAAARTRPMLALATAIAAAVGVLLAADPSAEGVVALIALLAVALLLVRNEELRRAHRALEERATALSGAGEATARFVADLSHELRNPLAAVSGYAELLAAGRAGPLSFRQQEHIEIMRESGAHALALIDELLDIARIEAGQPRLQAAPVDPAALLVGCATALQTMADDHAVTIAVHADGSGLVSIDPTRLRQVVLNYLSNAIKFSPAGGVVDVRLSREHHGIAIAVSDTGPGLCVADQARVFDAFFQAPGSPRTGSGLGLAVSRRIVEAQGGRVGLTSAPGAGSTFSAWLPAPAVHPVAEPVVVAPGRAALSGALAD